MELTRHGNSVEGILTFELYFESFDYKEDTLPEHLKFTSTKELFNMMQPDFIEELKRENDAEQVELASITFSTKENDTEAFITMFENFGSYRIATNLDTSGLENEYKAALKSIKEIVVKKL